MHIKKLEIAGFKSFVDRTVIQFDHDVLAIVGPNGCGKSNIVDSIRWCMGEQSARQLRGRAMEDVIFNGSETRGPHGMAEVTLTFDNTDAEQAAALPIEYRDYPEIAVTRRLYRDGTSLYLLNKVEVRLKDVIDVFLGTGVGTKAYSIVEQGKIGLIVSARPEDRRSLIEEAAGITKYKSRKKASERKMELTEQNLLRVADRAGELERSVASLQRQAAKAERYIGYRSELDQLVLHAAAHQLLEILTGEKFWTEARDGSRVAVDAARTELSAAETSLEVEREEARRLEDAAEQAQNAAFAADNEVRALQAEIARARDRLQHLGDRDDAARREQRELEQRAEALEGERREIAQRLTGLESEETQEAQVALAEHERLEALREDERAAESVLSGLRARASKAASQVAGAKAKLSGLERRTEEMQNREAKLSEQLAALTSQRDDLAARRGDLEGSVAELERLRDDAAAHRQELEQRLVALRQAIVASERSLDRERNALAQQRGRLKALEEMRARMEGVGDGVKNLIAKRDPTLLGLVVDRVQAPAEFTPAVAGLLGAVLECVVVSDSARAVDLLGELARDKKGRVSVVQAASAFAGHDSPERAPSPAAHALEGGGDGDGEGEGEGVLGPLIDRIQCAAEDRALVARLVGDAILVDSASTALELARQHVTEGRTFVTLDGMVFHGDGRITGGSGETVASGWVDEQRETRELREVCAELARKVEQEVGTHEGLREQMNALSASLEHARQSVHAAEIALISSQKDAKKTEEQLASLEHRLSAASSELGDIGQKLAEGGHEQAEAERLLAEGETILRDAEQQTEGAVLEAAAWRQQVASQLSVVTDKKVRLARVREQAASTRSTVDRLARSHGELVSRVAKLVAELDDMGQQSAQTTADLNAAEALLDEARTVAESTQHALVAGRRAFDEARGALGEREALLKTLRTRVTELADQLNAEELTLERLSINKDHLLASIREKFRGLELTKVVGDYHLRPLPDEAHTHRIGELSHLIDRMGPVNLDATREHREEKERLVFYTEQKADLEKALDDLRRAIGQMNRESKRLFRETYDAINERFKVLFPKLFNGGRAELHLTNPDDLLETGVEIVAQPPGKKLGNIELMSGGEKALTAVSLIFAIFQHKPSPFCILDEVDAPLDEANVTRYNEMIREMTDRSQFILITHIKRTMQSVDVLYGVTMQEAGISRLVSVKINESAQRRSGAPATVAGDEVQVA